MQSQDIFGGHGEEDDYITNLVNAVQNEEISNNKAEQSKKRVLSAEKFVPEKLTKLPLSRVKSIMKTDPDIQLASQESVFLIAKATELFLDSISKETYKHTAKAKRKTVQRRDVDAAIENIDALCFLEGALD